VLLAAEAKKRDEAVALSERVKSKQVTITAKAAGEEGKLYGSVTTQQIADEFAKLGLPIEARMILLDQPIKELGVFDVRLRLFPSVEVEAKVWVVEESAPGEITPAQASAEKAEAARPRERRRTDAAPRAAPAPVTAKETLVPAREAATAASPIDEQEALVPVGKKKQKRAQKEAEMAASGEEMPEEDAGKRRGPKKK
jgi:large subunit ribosomal protein L9